MMPGMPGGTQLAWGVSWSSPLACAALKAASFCAYSGVSDGCSGMPGPGRVRTPMVTSHTPLRSGVDPGASAATARATVANMDTDSNPVMHQTDFRTIVPLPQAHVIALGLAVASPRGGSRH